MKSVVLKSVMLGMLVMACGSPKDSTSGSGNSGKKEKSITSADIGFFKNWNPNAEVYAAFQSLKENEAQIAASGEPTLPQTETPGYMGERFCLAGAPAVKNKYGSAFSVFLQSVCLLQVDTAASFDAAVAGIYRHANVSEAASQIYSDAFRKGLVGRAQPKSDSALFESFLAFSEEYSIDSSSLSGGDRSVPFAKKAKEIYRRKNTSDLLSSIESYAAQIRTLQDAALSRYFANQKKPISDVVREKMQMIVKVNRALSVISFLAIDRDLSVKSKATLFELLSSDANADELAQSIESIAEQLVAEGQKRKVGKMSDYDTAAESLRELLNN